jgi:hypothetical protein
VPARRGTIFGASELRAPAFAHSKRKAARCTDQNNTRPINSFCVSIGCARGGAVLLD